MENASKALIMAGGILLALMIIGVLVLMFNQISSYQKTSTVSKKDSQIAIFNQDFAKYADEKELKGTDIISLVNKVVDYNSKEGVSNYIDYNKKITLDINVSGFASKYGVDGKSELFGRTTLYTITSTNAASNTFVKMINDFYTLEKKYTLKSMEKLKSSYITISNDVTNRIPIITSVYNATGKNMPEITTLDTIAKYVEYSNNFKSAIFESNAMPVYNEGQIVKLSFKFVK